MALKLEDYESPIVPAWCPGCGNFPILESLKNTLVELDLAPDRVLICTGIGQAPKLPHYMRVNTFNGLHGREVASAQGAKLAADDLTVIIHAGDGGAYGEGGNHFIHAVRRNLDLTLVVHDNHFYALTKGQASPTTEQGAKVKLQPRGVGSSPLNPLALAVSLSCSHVSQTTSALADHLTETLKAAIGHQGFSLVNVLQPCVTWDKVHTYQYYKERCRPLRADHDPTDQLAALKLVLEAGEEIPIGLIYTEERPVYGEGFRVGSGRPLRERGVEPGLALEIMDRFR